MEKRWVAVLVGDVIASRKAEVEEWLVPLKSFLSHFGQEGMDWNVYRGDSFQLRTDAENALDVAFRLRAHMLASGKFDVRIAIGLGEETYHSDRVAESNGSAYVRSGSAFEALKKGAVQVDSGRTAFDEPINLMLKLSERVTQKWTPVVAEAVLLKLENPNINQSDLAEELGKSQSTVSDTLKRSGVDDIYRILKYYNTHLNTLYA